MIVNGFIGTKARPGAVRTVFAAGYAILAAIVMTTLYNSRRQPGAVFFCRIGKNTDPHLFTYIS